MKIYKAIALLAVIAIATLSFFSCKKDRTLFNAHFYVSDTLQTEKLSLYINGELQGDLPSMVRPNQQGLHNCNNLSLDSVLNFKLPAGKYRIQARNEAGETVISGTMKFAKNGGSSSGNKGMLGMSISDDCLEVWMSESF